MSFVGLLEQDSYRNPRPATFSMLTAIVSASASFMDGSAMIRGAVPTVSRPAVAPIMQVNVFDQASRKKSEIKFAASCC